MAAALKKSNKSDAMSTSLKRSTKSAPRSPVQQTKKLFCEEVRTAMLVACGVQGFVCFLVLLLGCITAGKCEPNRFGEWAMVYSAAIIGCSAVSTVAVFGRHRRVALLALALGFALALIGLGIDGTSYFCVDLRGGVNRHKPMCIDHIKTFNLCIWMKDYYDNVHTLKEDGGEVRLAIVILLVLHMTLSVWITSVAVTEAGRLDLCQFEEALREMQATNQQLDYGKRARRNRILTKYISQAKPEEGLNLGQKALRFFGFGMDVDPIPVAERKVKIVMPKGAPPPPNRDVPS